MNLSVTGVNFNSKSSVKSNTNNSKSAFSSPSMTDSVSFKGLFSASKKVAEEAETPIFKTAEELNAHLIKLKYDFQFNQNNYRLNDNLISRLTCNAKTPHQVKFASRIAQIGVKNNDFSLFTNADALVKSVIYPEQVQFKLDLAESLLTKHRATDLVAMAETPGHAKLINDMASLTDDKGKFLFCDENIKMVLYGFGQAEFRGKVAKEVSESILPKSFARWLCKDEISDEEKMFMQKAQVKSDLMRALYGQLKDKIKHIHSNYHFVNIIENVDTAEDAQKVVSLAQNKTLLKDINRFTKGLEYEPFDSYEESILFDRLQNPDDTIEYLKHLEAKEKN